MILRRYAAMPFALLLVASVGCDRGREEAPETTATPEQLEPGTSTQPGELGEPEPTARREGVPPYEPAQPDAKNRLGEVDTPGEGVQVAIAQLRPVQGQNVQGSVIFRQDQQGELRMRVAIANAPVEGQLAVNIGGAESCDALGENLPAGQGESHQLTANEQGEVGQVFAVRGVSLEGERTFVNRAAVIQLDGRPVSCGRIERAPRFGAEPGAG